MPLVGGYRAAARRLHRTRPNCRLCAGGCGQRLPVQVALLRAPRVFSLQLTWATEQEGAQAIGATLHALDETVRGQGGWGRGCTCATSCSPLQPQLAPCHPSPLVIADIHPPCTLQQVELGEVYRGGKVRYRRPPACMPSLLGCHPCQAPARMPPTRSLHVLPALAPVPQAAGTYTLRSMACYYRAHYSAFVRLPELGGQ